MAGFPEQNHPQQCSGAGVWTSYLRQIAEGDDGALAALYDETSSLVFSVARSILGNAEDAEEITLDVFAYVWRSAATYDPRRGTVSTWLTMVARSRSLGRLRSLKAARGEEGWGSAVEGLPLRSSDSGTAITNGDRRILIQRALGRLSPEHRELIELAFFSGLSHQQLASNLKTPLGTIKGRLRMAISRLRDLIGSRNA